MAVLDTAMTLTRRCHLMLRANHRTGSTFAGIVGVRVARTRPNVRPMNRFDTPAGMRRTTPSGRYSTIATMMAP
jgi:hypothetical protein